ncbi:hypothetical protein UF64_09675 [Thalassospira sp. HJ]|uniref:helix-turn-helix domain-containing protein n=1 Tax=Thalassospira sp. HJ TaxID=1616823 RepID=UPI0005CDDAD0|nr:helix-turn-helix transcriptional regulator [Thalassospira sp. HJ]KJE35504.1 hypothetical protein UF64_09675 [Thalassospira sp. HJ]
MDIRETVGANIRRIRRDSGMSQEALAHKSGIAPSFLSQIENGKRSPTVTTLAAIAGALRVRVIDFFAE